MRKTRGRNKIIVDGWKLEPYSGKKRFSFDCGDTDLNSFFHEDVEKHDKALVAKTFILSPDGLRLSGNISPSAFISFCNDSIRRETFGTKSQWKKAVKDLPLQKRYETLPAVKIARLGVDKNYKGRGIGTRLLNTTIELFLYENRTGCRFLTVDSYFTQEALTFYIRNGFQFFSHADKQKYERAFTEECKRDPIASEPSTFCRETITLWFDLLRVF